MATERGLPILVVFFAALSLVGCADAKRTAQAKVADQMRDPASAQFRAVKVRKSGAVCGEVNAKNGYGGYVGFREFVVTPTGEVLVDPGMPDRPQAGRQATVEEIEGVGNAFDWIAKHLEWCVNNE